MSVIISSYAKRTSQDGQEFIALILTGQPEMVKSSKTGKFYCVARNCSIPSSFTEEVAKQSIGTVMPGTIVKVPAEEYEFTTTSGQTVTLDFSWEYQDTNQNIEEKIFN